MSAVSSKASMTTFDDYLREVRLSVEQYDSLPSEAKGVEICRYGEWLKLKNPQPQPASASGNGRLSSQWRLHLMSS